MGKMTTYWSIVMVKKMRNFLMAVGLLVLAGMTGSCSLLEQAVQKPTLQVADVSYHAVSFQKGRLDSHLRIHNPNGFALPIRNVTYSLKLNERQVVSSNLAVEKKIPADGTIEILVPVHFRYSDVMNSISDLVHLQQVRFQFAGTLDIGLLTIPFSKRGAFALKY